MRLNKVAQATVASGVNVRPYYPLQTLHAHTPYPHPAHQRADDAEPRAVSLALYEAMKSDPGLKPFP